MTPTIEQLESQLEQKLTENSVFRAYVPEGYRPHVEFFSNGAKPRKKRKNASADSWSPDSGEIRISFVRNESRAAKTAERSAERPAESLTSAVPPVRARNPSIDLIRALHKAESRPGFDFVSLKWFRDLYLPAEGFDWAQSIEARDQKLREAIGQGWIVTSRKPNPKAPQFPVTAICVNQQNPEVARMLGTRAPAASNFDPIEIRGESLSTTILRERR